MAARKKVSKHKRPVKRRRPVKRKVGSARTKAILQSVLNRLEINANTIRLAINTLD